MIITGKGNKERIVILPEFLLNYIKDYLKNDYRDFDNNKTNYLFG
jgi:site-specific recombinase XerD